MQDWARAHGPRCLIGDVLVAVGIVSLWTPLIDAEIARALVLLAQHRCYLAPVPIVTACARAVELALARPTAPNWPPFIGAHAGCSLMSYLGIAISLWPMIVPHHFTLWEAASSPSTQAFLLVGTLFLLPVISDIRRGPTGCSAARSAPGRATTDYDCECESRWDAQNTFATIFTRKRTLSGWQVGRLCTNRLSERNA